MLFDCRNGQVHVFRYLRHRFFLNTAQNEDPAGLRGEFVENALHPPEVIARAKLRLHVIAGLEEFDFTDRLERDDLVTPGLVDDEIARDGEEIGLAVRHLTPIGIGKGTRQNFGNQVLMFVKPRSKPPQPGTQRRLVRQDDSLEPVELGTNVFHRRTLFSWFRMSSHVWFLWP